MQKSLVHASCMLLCVACMVLRAAIISSALWTSQAKKNDFGSLLRTYGAMQALPKKALNN